MAEHLDAIRLCLVGIIGATVFLWTVPAKCPHDCHQCRIDKAERDRKRLLDAHNAWHDHPIDGCPFCRP